MSHLQFIASWSEYGWARTCDWHLKCKTFLWTETFMGSKLTLSNGVRIELNYKTSSWCQRVRDRTSPAMSSYEGQTHIRFQRLCKKGGKIFKIKDLISNFYTDCKLK